VVGEEAGLVSRRSCLSVPGNSAKMLAKAVELSPDELVIDLEDSVPADQKASARRQVCEALAAGGWRARSIAVRINAVSSHSSYRDVVELIENAGDRLDTLVIPKVESAGDVDFVARLAGLAEQVSGRTRPVGLQLLIETAKGLVQIHASAAASPRVESLIVGYADLAASLGLTSRTGGKDDGDWTPVRLVVLTAARDAGVAAIDGPYFQVRDLSGLAADASRAARQGFDGKWAIHPDQIDILNESFSPTPDELDRADALIAGLDRAGHDQQLGAILHEGQMVDEAMRKQVLRIIARGRPAGGTHT
jgi:citrate lyase subunit beta / citryl-CoA lyase